MQSLLLDKQVKRWTQQVRTRAERYLDGIASRNSLEGRHLKAALMLEELASVAANLDHVTRKLEELASQPAPDRTTSTRELGEEVVTVRARRDQLIEQRHELFTEAQRMLAGELTLREDLSTADARDAVEALLGTSGPGQELMRLLRLQGEWLQRIGTDQNLITAFLRTRQVVSRHRTRLPRPPCRPRPGIRPVHLRRSIQSHRHRSPRSPRQGQAMGVGRRHRTASPGR